jgi:adenylate kinase
LQEKSAARADAEDQEEDDGKAAEDSELLDAINENREENNGRIGDQYVIRFLKEKLCSKPCQNQGFILDGYPKTTEQAKELFACERNSCCESLFLISFFFFQPKMMTKQRKARATMI